MNTPILFIIYNRPETTQAVFDVIKSIKPTRLFIAADGPKTEEDVLLCEQARSIIKQIDWDTDCQTRFLEKNMGCKLGVSSAISWFFDQVEAGIILEDDCVPHPDFFGFTSQLLDYYQNDNRIMMITGTNYLKDSLKSAIPSSYFFSRYFAIWGWATWRRAWELYDISMKQWPKLREQNQLSSFYSHQYLIDKFNHEFDLAYHDNINCWGIQWFYSCLFNHGLSVVPKVNMISNIGVIGTHTNADTKNNYFQTFNLSTQSLHHPVQIYPEVLYEEPFYEDQFAPKKKRFFSFKKFML